MSKDFGYKLMKTYISQQVRDNHIIDHFQWFAIFK